MSSPPSSVISHAEERIAFLTTLLNQRDFSKIEPLFKKHLIDLKLLWEESKQLQLKTNPQSYDDRFTQLYNILIRLIYENKRLTREQEENTLTLVSNQKDFESLEKQCYQL